MKADPDSNKSPGPLGANRNRQLSTTCSSSGCTNQPGNHPTKGAARWAECRNHSEKLTLSHENSSSPTRKESQASDFHNGNTPPGCTYEEVNCKLLEKPHQRVAKDSRRNGKAMLKDTVSTHSIKDAPKGSPTKNIFLFWANKADDSSKATPRTPVFQKAPEKTHGQVKSHSQLSVSEAVLDGVKGEKQVQSDATETAQKKTRKDLYPDPKVFSHIDAHVLRASEQIKSRQGLSSVQTIVRLITEEAQSKLEMVRAIWMWLCHNIEYDVDGFLGLSQKIHTPEQVLKTRRGVCSGYAYLCQEMCREVGLSCVGVPGYGRGTGYRQGLSCLQKKSSHMWNAVQLEGQWHLLDTCWGAGIVDVEKRRFIPRHNDFFFLTDPKYFIETHWPEDPAWQLVEQHVSLEDFEQRVFKTSEFFKLQLSLLSPDVSLLKTAHGEATVALKSAHPTDFSYHLSKLSGEVSKDDMGTTHGMMTVSKQSMTLKVTPPTEGLFDLMVFARPSDSPGPYHWVCSYQIQCLEPISRENLPENPFHFWGLHQKVKDFGIEDCSWREDLVVAARGSLLLTLQTTRPLLATYELVHQELDASLSKKCLASQAEEDKLSCHVLCPFRGYYRLSVFVKDLGDTAFENAANFLIRCSGPINRNELFPSGLSMHCGSGTYTRGRGLSNPSHPAPIITTLQGKCNITFHARPDVEVAAVLSKDNVANNKYPMERYVLLTHLRNKVGVCILLPEPGIYKVGLFGRNKDHKDFAHVCDYIIRCFSNRRWPPFPRVYSRWRRGCILLQPRTGVLQEQSWVTFRVKMPKAYKALVIGHAKTELKPTQSKIWEGEVHTGPAGTLLKLVAKFSQQSTSMEVVLSFDVGSSG